MSRKIDHCLNCGESREMAAHGLCFACYRREERVQERAAMPPDRHNPGIRREHKKLFVGFTSVMKGLSDLGVAKQDVLRVREIINFYIGPIQHFLNPPERGGPSTSGTEREAPLVNSEQQENDVHVHPGPQEQGKEPASDESIEIAARAVGVSTDDVRRAMVVKEEDPGEFARIERGETTIIQAYRKTGAGERRKPPIRMKKQRDGSFSAQ